MHVNERHKEASAEAAEIFGLRMYILSETKDRKDQKR